MSDEALNTTERSTLPNLVSFLRGQFQLGDFTYVLAIGKVKYGETSYYVLYQLYLDTSTYTYYFTTDFSKSALLLGYYPGTTVGSTVPPLLRYNSSTGYTLSDAAGTLGLNSAPGVRFLPRFALNNTDLNYYAGVPYLFDSTHANNTLKFKFQVPASADDLVLLSGVEGTDIYIATNGSGGTVQTTTTATVKDLVYFFLPFNYWVGGEGNPVTPSLPSVLSYWKGESVSPGDSTSAAALPLFSYCTTGNTCVADNCFGTCPSGKYCLATSASATGCVTPTLDPAGVHSRLSTSDFNSLPNLGSFIRGRLVPVSTGVLEIPTVVVTVVVGRLVQTGSVNKSNLVVYFLKTDASGKLYLVTDFMIGNANTSLTWYQNTPKTLSVSATSTGCRLWGWKVQGNQLTTTPSAADKVTLDLVPTGNTNMPSGGLYAGVPYRLSSTSANRTLQFTYEYVPTTYIPTYTGSKLYTLNFSGHSDPNWLPQRTLQTSSTTVTLADLAFYFFPTNYYTVNAPAVPANIYSAVDKALRNQSPSNGFVTSAEALTSTFYNYCTSIQTCGTSCFGQCALTYQTCSAVGSGHECSGEDTGTGTDTGTDTGTGTGTGTDETPPLVEIWKQHRQSFISVILVVLFILAAIVLIAVAARKPALPKLPLYLPKRKPIAV